SLLLVFKHTFYYIIVFDSNQHIFLNIATTVMPHIKALQNIFLCIQIYLEVAMKFFKTDEKKFSKRERIFYTILTLFALACVLLNTNGGRAVTAAVTKRELPIYCVDTDEKKLAISFDAAWGNEDTE